MLLSEINGDRAIRRIDMTPLRRKFTPNLHRLVRIIIAYGFKVRIVGGSVRDVLIGKEPRDIDLITDALPDAVMYILGKHDINYITKGIPHGTVKIRFPADEEYEITSLGYEVTDDCCPRSVVVHSGESWRGDAQRRDFTIDTMSVTMDGQLYDYVGGYNDLRSQTVKFLGSATERVQKDPILIMRFFKLLALFRDPKYDKGLLPMLKEKMKLVKKIKPARLQMEIGNIERGQNGAKVRALMRSLGFDQVVGSINVKEAALICESIHDLVPAIIAELPDGSKQVFAGERSDNHGLIYDRYYDQLEQIGAGVVDSGFYNTRTQQYLTRAEAQALVNQAPGVTPDPPHKKHLHAAGLRHFQDQSSGF